MMLDIKIIRNGSQIKLSQAHYIEKVLKRFSLLDTNLVSNPLERGKMFDVFYDVY